MAEDIIDRVRRFPLFSTAVAVSPLTAFISPPAYIMFAMAATPVLSVALSAIAAIDLFRKNRSGLSKVFSVAAAGTGMIGPVLMAQDLCCAKRLKIPKIMSCLIGSNLMVRLIPSGRIPTLNLKSLQQWPL